MACQTSHGIFRYRAALRTLRHAAPNALQGLRAFFSYPNLDRLASLYWSFYNPSFLFFSGDRMMTFSTRSVGVFTLPVAVLLLLGLYHVCVRRRTVPAFIVVAGFVTAPVGALLGGENAAIIRAVELLPFTVLLATFGLEYLLSQPISNRASIVVADWHGSARHGRLVPGRGCS